jgi:hypothetical protein
LDINIKVKIDKDILNMDKNLHKGTIKGLEKCGDLTENEIKKTKSFIDRTGMLRRSIKRQKVDEKTMSVDIEAGMEYGLPLNEGTRRGISPRKFMEEGLDKASKSFENIIGKAIIKEI